MDEGSRDASQRRWMRLSNEGRLHEGVASKMTRTVICLARRHDVDVRLDRQESQIYGHGLNETCFSLRIV